MTEGGWQVGVDVFHVQFTTLQMQTLASRWIFDEFVFNLIKSTVLRCDGLKNPQKALVCLDEKPTG